MKSQVDIRLQILNRQIKYRHVECEKEFVLNDDKDSSHGVKLIKAN